ncbi:hypothetical protein J4E91_002028 [Alternaria rosae]|uniref:uncharacterized protein n=1 Tax=Alternaria rosae TaxID=1187941 RepID=UPI001E8D9012|nr:uncharacterized protein BKA58DRAFT_437824 [Alternaria rosae]KAH6875868.1 hypothetical protein BKA58DRAFT_437824 [Alternaria rosae]KAI4954316.1 hypothetical protein J4E91_002028 [Alternaria rosae]
MVNFNIAYTSRINPAGATPLLNQTQIWAGLQRKIRFAQEFVPVIESCEVLEDKDGVVTRDVKFKKGMGPKDQAKEVVRSYWPSWVDFEQEDGTHIRNIVSDGPSGEIEDLNMTYMFEFSVPHVQEGTPEAEKEIQKFKGMAKKAVESSIDAIREMVKDGRI